MVGTGLAGASAAASLAELGYNVKVIHFPRLAPPGPLDRRSRRRQRRQELPQRRRLGVPPVPRHREGRRLPGSREANVYRLAQLSVNIIDQCAAQGVPFAREYGGLLANRSFGGAQVSRTFYARGQTGQQLLLGAYQALAAPDQAAGKVTLYNRSDMLDVVVKDGEAKRNHHPRPANRRGASARRPTPWCSPPAATATSTTCRPTRWRPTSPRRGGPIARAPSSRTRATRRSTRRASRPPTSSSRSSPSCPSRCATTAGSGYPADMDESRSGRRHPWRATATTTSRRSTRAFGNLVPRDVASRNAKTVVDEGRGVGPLKNGVYLDFAAAIERDGVEAVQGALRQPLRHVRAHHRRGPVLGADAHLPGHPLHDGWPLGRLQPDDHRPRPVRPRRSELLRSRRQPARCLGPHAGPRRRLLCPALHDRRLPRPQARRDTAVDRHRSGVHRSAIRGGRRARTRAVDAGPTPARTFRRALPPRARQDRLGVLRHGPQRDRPREGAVRDPGPARGVPQATSRVLGSPDGINTACSRRSTGSTTSWSSPS